MHVVFVIQKRDTDVHVSKTTIIIAMLRKRVPAEQFIGKFWVILISYVLSSLFVFRADGSQLFFKRHFDSLRLSLSLSEDFDLEDGRLTCVYYTSKQ